MRIFSLIPLLLLLLAWPTSILAAWECDPLKIIGVLESPPLDHSKLLSVYVDSLMRYPQMDKFADSLIFANYVATNSNIKALDRTASEADTVKLRELMERAHQAFVPSSQLTKEIPSARIKQLASAFFQLEYRTKVILENFNPSKTYGNSLSAEDYIKQFPEWQPVIWQKLRRVAAKTIVFLKSEEMIESSDEYRKLIREAWAGKTKKENVDKTKYEAYAKAMKKKLSDHVYEWLKAEFPEKEPPYLTREKLLKISEYF